MREAGGEREREMPIREKLDNKNTSYTLIHIFIHSPLPHLYFVFLNSWSTEEYDDQLYSLFNKVHSHLDMLEIHWHSQTT